MVVCAVRARSAFGGCEICRQPAKSFGCRTSVNVELEHDPDEDVDRGLADPSRVEAPLLHRAHGLLIEAVGIERARHADGRRNAVPSHDHIENDRPLNLQPHGFARVIRPYLAQQCGRGDAVSGSIGAAAESTPRSGTEPGTSSRSDARAGSGSNAAAGPWTQRKRQGRWRLWCAHLRIGTGSERYRVKNHELRVRRFVRGFGGRCDKARNRQRDAIATDGVCTGWRLWLPIAATPAAAAGPGHLQEHQAWNLYLVRRCNRRLGRPRRRD